MDPLHHFELHVIVPMHLFGIDISINQAVVMMWIVAACIVIFFLIAGWSARLVPTRIQSVAEMSIELIRGMVLENMGERGMRYLPFIITCFFFVLFSNLLGLIPGSYTVTSQLFVTGMMALMVYGLSLFVGFSIHGVGFFKILVPPGVPGWLVPVIILIETISQLARPLTLGVRLFANMTAGHTVLAVLFWLMMVGGVLIGWVPFAFTVGVYLLEVIVAFIQAYIFAVLATVYLGDAIKLHE